MSIDRAAEDFDPVEAVNRYLSESGFNGKIFHTDETIFTVSDASSAVGAPEEEILKSILLRVNRGECLVLALMSGINRVDTKKIKKILAVSHVSFANQEECCNWSGFKPGGIPPVGYPEQPVTLLDEDLFQYPEVWAAAGTDHEFFPISPEELKRITRGESADIKK
ncbi:MAG: YbaK/EbsC family protein [Synergistaceae bacterium]|nr:YbaK/EbsC family protein [Synergistaceae bacterium]